MHREILLQHLVVIRSEYNTKQLRCKTEEYELRNECIKGNQLEMDIIQTRLLK